MKQLLPSLIFEQSFSEYQATNAVSASKLEYFMKPTAAHAKWAMENPKDSDALAFGRAVHTRLLEPAQFDKRYHVYEKFEKRSNEAKARWAEMVKTYGEDCLLTLEDAALIESIRLEVMLHDSAKVLIEDAEMFEISGYWEEDGMLCKFRADAICPRYKAIVDVKTCRDASEAGFAKAIADYGYHRKAAHYIAGARACGLDVDAFAYIAIESEGPVLVATYQLDAESLEVGARQRKGLMAKYRECEKLNRYSGYSRNIEPIGLPAWAAK
jgi:hypothetical protein